MYDDVGDDDADVNFFQQRKYENENESYYASSDHVW